MGSSASSARIALASYSAFVLYLTLQPFELVRPFSPVHVGLHDSIPDLGMNLFLFVPVGLLFVLSFGPSAGLLVAVVSSLGFSLVLEATQTMTHERGASIGDLVANGLGATLGALVARPSGPLESSSLAARALGAARREPAISATAFVIVAWSLLPYSDLKWVEDLFLGHGRRAVETAWSVVELIAFVGFGRALAGTSLSWARRVSAIALAAGLVQLLRAPFSPGIAWGPSLACFAASMVSASFWASTSVTSVWFRSYAIGLPFSVMLGARGELAWLPRIGPSDAADLLRWSATFVPIGVSLARVRPWRILATVAAIFFAGGAWLWVDLGVGVAPVALLPLLTATFLSAELLGKGSLE
ncbi:MAG: VanZ family protein [Deltaproteobacteria bacterium]|nr:VanZ family protein [Deltaproteobacteria bacterium]